MEEDFKEEEEYMQLVQELRSRFKEEYRNNEELYIKQDYDKIMDCDNNWHCGRYLKHYSMDLDRAFEKMKETLQWRKEIKIDQLSSTDFPKELWLYSSFFSCGKSKDDCGMIYILNSHHRVLSEPIMSLSKNFFLYYFEEMEKSHPKGDKVYIVFDESNSSLSQIDLHTSRWLLSIRDNYPDRIKSILVVGLAFVLRPIVRMIISWLPKEWKSILVVGTMEQLVLDKVDVDELPWFLGGSIGPECRLAPSESKWASEMAMFKDESVLKSLYELICFHASDEDKELFRQLQMEHDANFVN